MSVETVDKPTSLESKPERKIKIDRKADVEELLKKAKAIEPEKPEKRRGRPPKVRPDSSLEKYRDFPISVEINKLVATVLNATFTKPNLMKPDDTKIGEALIYTCEYYGWSIFEHPLLIMAFAVGGTFFTAWSKKQEVSKSLSSEPPKEATIP